MRLGELSCKQAFGLDFHPQIGIQALPVERVSRRVDLDRLNGTVVPESLDHTHEVISPARGAVIEDTLIRVKVGYTVEQRIYL
jgi:hypothetical protein